MLLSTPLETLIAYESWANRLVLESLRQNVGLPPKAHGIMAHVCAASRLWLHRLIGSPQSMPVWPELTLDQMDSLVNELERDWKKYLGDGKRLSDDAPVKYVNSMGDPFQNRPSEILAHAFFHGAYHRGQIALLIRQSGHTPPLTDYIVAIRTGAIRA